jgi:putative iron-dependent peroxidase
MAMPQPGILALGTLAHFHLEFDVDPRAGDHDVLAALARLREPSVTGGGTNLVIGFGASLGRRLAPAAIPAGFADFPPVATAPATPHDLWLWVHGGGPDIVLDVARLAAAALAPVATVAAEQACFVYRDSRDLTGFIDGTENPPVHEAPGVAIVSEGEPGAGGSVAFVQRWVHDLVRFQQLPVAEQEGIIGRTKADSVELDDDVKPPTAHISRVVIEDDDGEELEIFRRSVPYGGVGQLGLQFVAFTAHPERIVAMLERMFGISGDGEHDRLTEFSTPVTGAFYFAPSLETLDALAARAE